MDVVLSREIPWFVRKASNFGFLNWNSPPIGPIKLKRWGALSFILQDPFAVSYTTEWEFDMQASSSIYCKIHRRRVVLNSNTHESKSRIIVKFYSYLVVDFAIFTDKETCQGRGNLVNEKLFVCTDYRVVRIYFYVQKPALISDLSLLYCTRDRWKYTNRTQLKRIKIQGLLAFMFYVYFFNANVANSKSSQTRVSVLLRVPNCRNGRIEVIYIYIYIYIHHFRTESTRIDYN